MRRCPALLSSPSPDYYGFRDEDDGVITPLEAAAEKLGIRALLCHTCDDVQLWRRRRRSGRQRRTGPQHQRPPLHSTSTRPCRPSTRSPHTHCRRHHSHMQDYDGSEVVKPDHYVAHVAVPSQVDVETMLVMRQRKARERCGAGGLNACSCCWRSTCRRRCWRATRRPRRCSDRHRPARSDLRALSAKHMAVRAASTSDSVCCQALAGHGLDCHVLGFDFDLFFIAKLERKSAKKQNCPKSPSSVV